MARLLNQLTTSIPALILCFMFGQPLRAQLDPKLQGSTTDFLDLFQQSSQAKVKPEILTIFDFSGSMTALMFHPQYVNTDSSDSGSTCSMDFTLHPGTTGTPGNNTYTITATAHGCPSVKTTYTVTVNGTGASSGNTGPGCTPSSVYTITAKAAGSSSTYDSVNITVGGYASTQSNYTTTSYKITTSTGSTTNPITMVPSSGPYAAGSTIAFTAYLTTTKSNHNIIWSGTDGSGPTTITTTSSSSPYKSNWNWVVPSINPFQISNITTGTTTFAAGSNVTFNASLLQHHGSDTEIDWSDGNGWTATGTSVTWPVPAFDNGIPGTDPYVSATLSGLSGAACTQLVKPDGSVVTKDDAGSAANPTGYTFHGIGATATDNQGDVRNWIRAASHARFTYTDTSNSNTVRTVDVPIPWKITDRNSSGSPLSSKTIYDRISKIATDGTKTDYGSGLNIEYDLMYTLANGDEVLSGSSSVETTSTLSLTSYKNAYLTWLFKQRYQGSSATSAYYSPTNAGKYIVFDAAAVNLAAGQGTGNLAWGQGYGTFASGDTMTVPQSKLDGSYSKEVVISAAKNVVPALMRVQAVKQAAIQTWVQYQADVLWAFRFLDDTGEANSGSATTIDNNSSTNIASGNPTTTYMVGRDSGWKLLNNTSGQGNTSTTGNSVTGMKRIAALFANTWTPLTYAVARGLVQFTDPSSVFNSMYTTSTSTTNSNPVTQCLTHFLILFTDGVDNNGGSGGNGGATPYITGSGTTASPYAFSAKAGNDAILKTPSLIDRTGTNWNLFTFAGVGAHMADSTLGVANTDFKAAVSPGTTSTSGTPSSFLPYAIYQRYGTIFDHNHRITTMTVGVSLGGKYTDSTSPKRNLFLAAALGDPTLSSWSDLSTLTPFQWDSALNNNNGGRVPGSLYFFDGTDPDSLTTNLNYAIQSAIGASLINVTSNPNLPFIGSSIGKQIYLGKFQPPTNGGVMWTGDLLMFPTKVDATTAKTVILDNTGKTATTFDSTTAVWSAANALVNNRRWDARPLYTRTPGQSTLTSFTYTGTAYSNSDSSTPPGLKNYVAVGNSAYATAGSPMTQTAAQTTAQQNLIEFVMGANLLNPFSSTPSVANRANIMGDIIDSSPAYLEYNWSEVNSRFPTGSALKSSGRSRFRIILVGDNQGWLHAFGETSNISSVAPDATKPTQTVDLVSGEVDELWAFMPTDFLAHLDYLNTQGNAHKFMVDGSPTIYFLDLPGSTGGAGNGVLDGSSDTLANPLTDTTHERAIAIIGLRKGGRSYYALNLHDPFTPTLQWSLVPDEADSFDTNRNKTGLTDAELKGIIGNMGYSTSTPSIGRILYGGAYKDVVFFGGGYSVPEIEAKFTGTPKLGRSVIAVDVNTGDILAAVDLTNANIGGTSIGPVPAGVVPFEFFLGSGMTQRAYFMDMWGGLWCWGSKQVVSSTDTDYVAYYDRFRKDTSDLKNWTATGAADTAIANTGIRKVYQDGNSVATTTTSGGTSTTTFAGPMYTTLPAPFLVGTFPGKGHTTGTVTTAIPAAVGIAMESGNRNDPLDFGANKPANTRLTVVFDRQDSRVWGMDTETGPDAGINSDDQLLNAGKWGAAGANSSTLPYGDASITPGTSYYLAPGDQTKTLFGYYVTFPNRAQDANDTTKYHYSKGINPPLVVAGSAYYSYFTPSTADVCTGGSGFTYSDLICDVMNPVVKDVRSGLSCTSGKMDTWVNVASDFSMLGAPGVQQAGTRAKADPNDASKQVTYMDTNTYLGQGSQRYPRPRVWRTVH
jgi:hypothetical protein